MYAYANALDVSGDFPKKVSDIEELHVEVEWTYSFGEKPAKVSDSESVLTTGDLAANVALDMFLDLDEKLSSNPERALMEIMIWFGHYGPAAQPVNMKDKDTGALNPPTMNHTIDDTLL